MKALANCIILDDDGRLLLLHRATAELTQWELPGGKIEPGESPSDAAVRELTEELGITVEILAELGHAEFIDRGRRRRYHWLLAVITAGQPRPLEAAFDAVRYFELEQLENRDDLSANARRLLREFSHTFGPNAGSKIARTRNELAVQQENNRIRKLAAGILDYESRRTLALSFACECSNPDCDQTVAVPATIYSKIHRTPGWFVVAPGHEQPDIEHPVSGVSRSDESDYVVVEKLAVKAGKIRET